MEGAKQEHEHAKMQRNDMARSCAPVRALMDLGRRVEIQLSQGTGMGAPRMEPGSTVSVEVETPSTEAPAWVIQNPFAKLPTSQPPGRETRTFLDQRTERSTIRFRDTDDMTDYFIESAYVWSMLFDGYRAEELLAALFLTFSAEVRSAVVRALTYFQRPRWIATRVFTSVHAVASASPEGRRQIINQLLLARAMAQQQPPPPPLTGF